MSDEGHTNGLTNLGLELDTLEVTVHPQVPRKSNCRAWTKEEQAKILSVFGNEMPRNVVETVTKKAHYFPGRSVEAIRRRLRQLLDAKKHGSSPTYSTAIADKVVVSAQTDNHVAVPHDRYMRLLALERQQKAGEVSDCLVKAFPDADPHEIAAVVSEVLERLLA